MPSSPRPTRGSTSCQPDLDELVQHQDFERAIGEAVARANESLSVIERVRHFRLMAEAFTVENGTMTPTLKLKRPLIYRLHKELFEGLYQHQRQRPGCGAAADDPRTASPTVRAERADIKCGAGLVSSENRCAP